MFTVAIGGAVPRQIPTTVSADGRLVIPEAGSFYVAGQSLARARAQVQSALQQRYRGVTADMSLSAPRTFYVHVSGSVPQPGRHLVPAVARVEDAIAEASATPLARVLRYAAPVVREEAPRWPALRNVSIVDRSGRARTVDLMRYFATGDLDSNPYLRDGDALYVPAFDPLTEGVVVGGAIDRPGRTTRAPATPRSTCSSSRSGSDPVSANRARAARPAGRQRLRGARRQHRRRRARSTCRRATRSSPSRASQTPTASRCRAPFAFQARTRSRPA